MASKVMLAISFMLFLICYIKLWEILADRHKKADKNSKK